VGSEVDWRGLGASYRVAPFDASIGETEKVDRLLHWLDLPAKQAPRLLMAWWHGADAVGHRRGPHRSDIAAQVAEQDAELGRLLAGIDARGLWPRTTLLVVSDHGMALATQRLDPEAALAEAGIEARVARAGGCAFVYLEDPGQREAARRALSGLDRTSVYARDEIPARLRVVHGERSGDLLLVTEPPATFARLDGWKTWLLAFGRLIGRGAGMHGYDPAHPDMGGVALALGRGVPAGARPEAWHAVDVAPTVAALLGIEAPAQAEGRVRLTAAQP
jgi:arylsulfatase A-like enzyme